MSHRTLSKRDKKTKETGASSTLAQAFAEISEKADFYVSTDLDLVSGSLGFRMGGPHIGALRLGKSAITLKVKVKALE